MHTDADALSRYPIGWTEDIATGGTDEYDVDERHMCTVAQSRPVSSMEEVENMALERENRDDQPEPVLTISMIESPTDLRKLQERKPKMEKDQTFPDESCRTARDCHTEGDSKELCHGRRDS